MRRSDYVDERSAVEQGECAPEPVCTGGARGREPFLEPRSPELCVLTDSSSVVVSGECDHVECQGAERPSSGVSRDASDGWTQCGYRDATESGFPVSVVSMEHLVCQSSLESDHGLACAGFPCTKIMPAFTCLLYNLTMNCMCLMPFASHSAFRPVLD